jgi:adenylyltransferase/sulfurtransferase
VIGTSPAIVGSIASNEVLKLIVGFGEDLKGKILIIDLLKLDMKKITLT